MNSRLLFCFCASSLMGMQAFAQTAVSGKVIDAATGTGMPGVSVTVKGQKTMGTITDADGAFTLPHAGDSNSVLVFSFIGYQTQEVKIGNQKNIQVRLQEDNKQLEEVVVVGYGTSKKKDLSGAISSMRMTEDIANLPNPNAMSALSSKVAGIRYMPTNNASGNNAGSMNIRGKNAIPQSVASQGVNQPLFVVDGVIFYGSLNELNTSDIQSIDVLKDASAAAIYGSRAANGVIIITTKRGLSETPVINVNSSWNFSGWSRMPKMVTDDTKFLKNRFYVRQASGKIPGDAVWSPDFDKAQLLNDTELDAYNQGIYTNWLDEISRTGFGQRYDVNVSGQGKKVNYYVSADYTRQKGIRKGDDYEKYNILTKVDIQAKEWLKIGLNANYLGDRSWGVPARIQTATWMSPYTFTHARQPGYEDWPNSTPDGVTASPFWGSGTNDSYLWTDKQTHSYNINGVGYIQVDAPFLPGLSYRLSLNARRNSGYQDVFNDPRLWVSTNNPAQMDDPSQFGGNVEGYSYTSLSSTWNVDNIFNYTRDFGKHHVDATVGYTREASNAEMLRTDFKGFTIPTNLGAYKQDMAQTQKISRTRSRTSSIGILARAGYNYKSTYYANFTFRRDGYSAFAPGNKWGNFYGASAAWVLSNENFLKDKADWLDYLKLRVSWGQNGSRSVAAYATIATLNTTYTWFGDTADGSSLGIVPGSLPNKDLTWATVEKFNVGLDFDLLHGRLGGSVDVYTGKTTDMLMNRSVPYPSGFQTADANAGQVDNNGVEITLNSINIDGDGKNKFRWESNIAFDLNRNKIKSLYGKNYKGEEADDVSTAVTYGFDSYYALMVGKPIGAAYDLKKLGIFQNQAEIDNYVDRNGNKIMPDAVPGDLKFEDHNQDGKIDANDRQYLGSMDPLFTMNIGNTLSYKNFSLFFNFRWMQGDDTHFLGFNPYAYTIGSTIAQLDDVEPWTADNPGNTYPRYGYVNTLNYLYWTPRTFLKLKDLMFAYDFDKQLIKPLGLQALRIYVAGTDLFTLTGWKGLDPEDGGTIAGDTGSTRYGSNGTYRTFTAGINLTF